MNISTIYIGSDHRGFELKQHIISFLRSQGKDVVDCGNSVYDQTDDYPDYATAVAQQVANNTKSLGIVICGTGVGVSIVANKVPGIRSAVLNSLDTVKVARNHNHLNVLALSAENDPADLLDIVVAFIETEPSYEERHIRRISKITAMENNSL